MSDNTGGASGKKVKAVCLLSGGLDSTLAARMIIDQGIEVKALNFVTSFCTCTPKTSGCAAATTAARQLGIEVKTMNTTAELIELVRDPPHEHGSNLNPCIDCRILVFKKALEYMREIGASFIITGEVLGERPMSQRREAMMTIERDSGTKGLVVRPLSAVLLGESDAEKQGLVDRSKFLSISGRSRKPQIELAREFGIKDYPCPAGGCRLTDPGFAGRMLDILQHSADVTIREVNLLRNGRHVRLSPEAKAVIGRNREENDLIEERLRPSDTLVKPAVLMGPSALITGLVDDATTELACRIVARYVVDPGEPAEFHVTTGGESRSVTALAFDVESADKYLVKPLPPKWRRHTKLPLRPERTHATSEDR